MKAWVSTTFTVETYFRAFRKGRRSIKRYKFDELGYDFVGISRALFFNGHIFTFPKSALMLFKKTLRIQLLDYSACKRLVRVLYRVV